MWPFDRKKKALLDERVTRGEFIAIVIATCALVVSIGVARWSWLLLDEQIALRSDIETLLGRQEQVEIQYEHWFEKVRKEGQMLRDARLEAEDRS